MIEHTVRELLEDEVELDIEGIDRLYLNAYQPRLQTGGGVVGFFREHRGAVVASTTLMAPMSKAFVAEIHRFAKREEIEVVHFARGQRKDDETQRRLKQFQAEEGMLYIGVAQEKFAGFRVMKKISAHTGTAFAWLYRSTVMCNQYYFYVLDADFGPLFIKFSSYFPYTARVCLNGHEYAKRQLEKAGIAFEALDNGIRRCADPQRLQQVLDGLDEVRIEAVVRKWFARLIFERRIIKRTPGRFSTRVITQGVTPSLHISYKSTKIKQYFKEERALRTETTINNSRDFAIGRRLPNLPALRAIGFAANRRVLEVERISQDCQLGEGVFDQVNRPQIVDGQRASALAFGDGRVMALFQALCLFILLPEGFRNATLRQHVAELMGKAPECYSPGRMTYDLRRLRLHGLIEGIPHTHRYEVTALGKRVCLFFTKVNARIIRPGLSQLFDGCPKAPSRPLATAMRQLDRSCEQLFAEAKLAA
jgi:hypothetical protein